ncbi:MAG: tetratricopeptide repeat protein [Candidatus Omnitrophota bacterium]
MHESKNIPVKSKTPFLQKLFLVSLGILCCVFLIETSLRLGGKVFSALQQHRNYLSMKQKGAYRILCLGESTTANQYPVFLEKTLNQRNTGIKFSVIDKGVSATNTAYILDRLEFNLDAYHPDMVITMMGINDVQISYYKDIPEATSWLFQHCKVYRFMRLICMHIVKKLKKQDMYGSVNGNNYLEAEAYLQQNKLSEAEALFKKALELNPKDYRAYLELGWFYQDQSRFSEAEVAFKKTIELNPKDNRAYLELGWLCWDQGRSSEAEAAFKKALELNPKDNRAYLKLGLFYQCQGRSSEAEAAFKKALELNPKDDIAYLELGSLCRDQGRFSEAETSFKKIIELNPKDDKVVDRAYRALKELYIVMGNSRLAREHDKKIRELGLNYYLPRTIDNYHKLKAILVKRGIVYICVQYPMRNLGPLKKMFQDNTEGIIFVNNENIFKEALKKSGYKEYFTDMFGGDFGHCTKKGNQLLAENIADSIFKEMLGR